MSTYNGARFLAEQLASLRAQTLASRMRLLVRDDGSTDGTVGVVTGFDPGDLAIDVIEGQNIGVRASFLELMRRADDACRFFLLSDQDDVWDPGKVEAAVAALAPFAGDESPVLYGGRSVVTREDLTPIGLTDDAPRGPSLHNALVENIVPGHTAAMNKALLVLARDTMPPDKVFMHDCWLYLLAAGLGRVIFDATPHARYRQHEANDIGYPVGKGRRLIGGVPWLFSDVRARRTRQARALRDAVGDRLAPADRALLDAFLDQRTPAARLRYLRRYGILYQRPGYPRAASVQFLVGRYRDDRSDGLSRQTDRLTAQS